MSVYEDASLFLLVDILPDTNANGGCWMGPSGYWKMEINVPWKDEVAVLDHKLWSILSMVLVTNIPGWSLGGQTIPSLLYLLHSWLEIPLSISLTRWYHTQSSSEAISLTSALFLVFEYIIRATATGNSGSFVMKCLVFSADPRRCCFTELNLITWNMLTATRKLSFDILLALSSSIIWIVCARSNDRELLWRLRVILPSKTFLFKRSCFWRMWVALVIIVPSSCVLLLHASNKALPTSLSRVKRTLRPSFASHRPGTCSNSYSFNLVLWAHSASFCKVTFGSCTSTRDLVNGVLVLLFQPRRQWYLLCIEVFAWMQCLKVK